MKAYNIQKANLDDIDAIYEIETLCFESFDVFDKQIFYYLLEKNALFLVVKISENNETLEKIVGFIVVIQKAKSKYEIVTLNVHPDWRNKGIATSLLLEIERYLILKNRAELQTNNQNENCVNKNFTIELMVYEKNEKAKSLYEKTGYKFIKYVRNYYRRNRNGIEMIKEINF